MTKDMILVGRETDGERCGDECPCMYSNRTDSAACILDDEGLEGRWADTGGFSLMRTDKCLATPAAVVLTPEGAEYLREIDRFFEREGTNGFRNGLLLHFPTIFPEATNG